MITKPLPCVVLGIDPGKVSGWATLGTRGLAVGWATLGTRGLAAGVHRSGEANRIALVTAAQGEAHRSQLPLIVIGEKWRARMGGKGRPITPDTIAGMGAAWERWVIALEEAGHPKRRTLRVDVGTWRKAILGGPSRRKSEQWKLAAQNFCKVRWGVDLEPDAAEAACIALWGTMAEAVARVLPKPRARRVG